MKKKALISLVAALALIGSQGVSATSLTKNHDLVMAFGGSVQAGSVSMLSRKEMVETEGQNILGAIAGFFVYTGKTLYDSWNGFTRNTWNNFTNNWNGGDALWATASGAVGGAYSSTMFRSLGYPGLKSFRAPVVAQANIRAGGSGLGFATFGVHGATSTRFQNQMNSYNYPGFATSWSNSYCGSCYRYGR